jgi:hypothetical protein
MIDMLKRNSFHRDLEGRSLKSSVFDVALLAVFLFQNLYNPVSAYATAVVNCTLLAALALSSRGTLYRIPIARVVVGLSALVLLWVMFMSIMRSVGESAVLLKYARNVVSGLFAAGICARLRATPSTFLNVLGGVLLFHVLATGCQWWFPSLDEPMAAIFGFTREIEILSSFTSRKLGASSGYDSASEFSVALLILSCLSYNQKRSVIKLVCIGASFAACFAASRLGMVFGLIVMLLFTVSQFKRLSVFGILGMIPLCVSVIYFTSIWVFPLISRSLGFEQAYSDRVSALDSLDGYGTGGTFEALTTVHLDPLQVPFEDLIFGYAVDPNKVPGRETDIGYVKLIYHIGVIGLLVVVLIYATLVVKLLTYRSLTKEGSDSRTILNFVLFFIILDALMNYKALVLYSRGSYEIVIIICFYLMRVKGNSGGRLEAYPLSNNFRKRVYLSQARADFLSLNRI